MDWREKNWLIKLITNSLRILCVIIFFHWILWVTTYSHCTSYQDSIKKSIKEKTGHNGEIDYGYQKFGRKEKKKIVEIEESILQQIETKSKKSGLTREWKSNWLPSLEKLDREKQDLEKKPNPSEQDKTEITKKEQEYYQKLKEGKEKTIKNIQQQLTENNLGITELDDGRNWSESLRKDPLKFFFLSPLDKLSKKCGLKNSLMGEIIFKLVIIKLLCLLLYHPKATLTGLQENAEKMKNPYLSVEEKEQINEEFSPLGKYLLANGAIYLLSIFSIIIHPSFLDKTGLSYQREAKLLLWLLPMVISIFLAGISHEFIRQERILKWPEFKTYLAKTWVFILIIHPLFMILLSYLVSNTLGSYLCSFLGGLIDFVLNTLIVIIFRKKRPISARSRPHFRAPRGPRFRK